MNAGWNGQYDSFQGQSGSFYDPASSQYNYDASTGSSQPGSNAYPNFMTPTDPYATIDQQGDDEFSNEPPLLEELGIYPEHIIQKTLSVLNPFRPSHRLKQEAAADADLAGPLVFCLAFGSLLLLTGKIHFNYIYGIGALGCVAMYGLLTLMNVSNEVAFTTVVSVLGYCILPIVGLAALGVIFSLQGWIGTAAAAAAVGWCSFSASKLFVTAFNMQHQQPLVAYPCAMLYSVFALITVF